MWLLGTTAQLPFLAFQGAGCSMLSCSASTRSQALAEAVITKKKHRGARDACDDSFLRQSQDIFFPQEGSASRRKQLSGWRDLLGSAKLLGPFDGRPGVICVEKLILGDHLAFFLFGISGTPVQYGEKV
ncbi:hypothetical protein BDK51DRAFT_31097 [Blyttiomyces helicus]|uniref:Secreted protein n=1 Tax=Blyttiomyces helicus TaxID=388810 RepID=A0A4P9WH97_9FUNG|nr:hypothetical protein BDK51DRAFT_31097 [Blyttiomyces helicus]|eukprot:RKO92104.1 hypothetical protein BDK51DRAFT_31097 [Blyttiomyces helicus]